MRGAWRIAVLVVLGAMAWACRAQPAGGPPPVRRERVPFIRVLGTAQDGGIPHAGCSCPRCEAARKEPARGRMVASLAVVIPDDGATGSWREYLVDCTPDVRGQIDRLRDLRGDPSGGVDRAPVDGMLLTHAHVGHYLGLAYFGFEAMNSPGVPVWCTARMGAFLRENGPWSQLVKLKNIDIRPIELDKPFELAVDVSCVAHRVPHRDEYSDTVGFLIRGPRRRVLYVPDTEPWRKWDSPFAEYLDGVEGGVQVLIVDGTFYSPEELPGRHAAAIGHPLMTDTMDLFEERVRAGRLEVWFTHMNHSNPVLEPGSAARAEVQRRGFHVLEDGAELGIWRGGCAGCASIRTRQDPAQVRVLKSGLDRSPSPCNYTRYVMIWRFDGAMAGAVMESRRGEAMASCTMIAVLGVSAAMAMSARAVENGKSADLASATGLEGMDGRNAGVQGDLLTIGMGAGELSGGSAIVGQGAEAGGAWLSAGGALGGSTTGPSCDTFDSRSLPSPGTLCVVVAGLAAGGRRRR